MARKTLYYCDMCEKEVDEVVRFTPLVAGEPPKLQVDLCADCRGKHVVVYTESQRPLIEFWAPAVERVKAAMKKERELWDAKSDSILAGGVSDG